MPPSMSRRTWSLNSRLNVRRGLDLGIGHPSVEAPSLTFCTRSGVHHQAHADRGKHEEARACDMILPEIKEIFCPRVYDLASYQPEEAAFCIHLQIVIGDRNIGGGEIFHISVGSPAYFAKRVSASGPCFGRGTLIVCQYDYDEIRDTLITYVNQTASETWIEVATKLNLVMRWEFENYRDMS